MTTSLPNLFDAELDAAEVRVGLRLPASARAFLADHAGQGAPSEGDEELDSGGLWLPPDHLALARDYELADHASLEDTSDEDLNRILILRVSEMGDGYVTLDYRNSDEPEVRLFTHDDTDDEEMVVFDTFDDFLQALDADPAWARPYLAYDPAFTAGMLDGAVAG